MSMKMTATTTIDADAEMVLKLEHGRLFGRRRLTSPHPYPPRGEDLHPYAQALSLGSGCIPLPPSLAALDLSATSLGTMPSLAALRAAVLSYLADLEQRLADAEAAAAEDAHAWVREALDMLARIRADVCAHLPDADEFRASVYGYAGDLKAHLNLPDLPQMNMPDLQARLKDVRAHLSDVSVDLSHPAHYLPVLRQHLRALHAHLSSYTASSERCPLLLPSLPTASCTSALLDRFLASDFAPAVLHRENGQASTLEKAASEMKTTLKKSLDGSKLVTYVDLPMQWRNNPWVNSGYRFIPLNKWPVILFSIFMLHNETLNIHTHMIPFLYKSIHFLFSLSAISDPLDRPETFYSVFAMFCLLASVIWHTMAGCAHLGGMELCARVDYVGIGWLISATIGTGVYYGFSCQPQLAWLYLSLCLAMGITGSIFPFMSWFNEAKYKTLRVLFFLSMALVGIAPLVHVSFEYGPTAMLRFIAPLAPSIAWYIIGLMFYMSHFPERYVCLLDKDSRIARWTDWLGGGSHAIWHLCIVVAIFQHRSGMRGLRGGVNGEGCVLL